MKTNEAKILLLDIETAPAVVHTFGLYDINVGVNQIVRDGYVLMWAAKWLGKKEVLWDSVSRHAAPKDYDTIGEREIAKSIWKLLDEADIVITHNGDDFDLRWLNAVFIKHHLPPVSTFKSVDTKKEAKKGGRFISNSLKWLLQKLDLGYKLDTGGFELWPRCMSGNKAAWNHMIKYCKNDVTSLERLYRRLRPYMKLHPNLGLFSKKGTRVCPNCSSTHIRKKGFFYTSVSRFQRWICLDCGKNIRDTHRDNGTTLVGV
jgi:hypothetical protein